MSDITYNQAYPDNAIMTTSEVVSDKQSRDTNTLEDHMFEKQIFEKLFLIEIDPYKAPENLDLEYIDGNESGYDSNADWLDDWEEREYQVIPELEGV